MASAIIQPLSVVQINLTGLYDGQRCICTFHYYAVAQGTAPQLSVATFAGRWIDKVWEGTPDPDTGLRQMFHETVTDVTVTGQIVVGPNSRSILEVFNPPHAEGAYTGGTALPSGTSIVLSRRGNRAGHKNRGRIYLFGVPTFYNDNSRVKQAAFDQFVQCSPGLEYAFSEGATPNILEMHPCIITSGHAPATSQIDLIYSMNDAIRYQRRREVGRGI